MRGRGRAPDAPLAGGGGVDEGVLQQRGALGGQGGVVAQLDGKGVVGVQCREVHVTLRAPEEGTRVAVDLQSRAQPQPPHRLPTLHRATAALVRVPLPWRPVAWPVRAQSIPMHGVSLCIILDRLTFMLSQSFL